MKSTLIIFLSLLYISTNAQNGVYLEYKGSVKGNEEATSVLKVSSLDGNSVNERTNLKYHTYPHKEISLKKNPDKLYHVLPTGNTYFIMDDVQLKEYKVKVLGNENVNGYNCVKIELSTHDRSDKMVTYVWVSKEIPSYEMFLSANVNGINLSKLNHELTKEGLGGIPVRIAYSDDNGFQYDLFKAELAYIDKAMFSLDDYKLDKGMSSDDMKKKNKITDEQYKLMKEAEQEAKNLFQQRDSLNKKN